VDSLENMGYRQEAMEGRGITMSDIIKPYKALLFRRANGRYVGISSAVIDVVEMIADVAKNVTTVFAAKVVYYDADENVICFQRHTPYAAVPVSLGQCAGIFDTINEVPTNISGFPGSVVAGNFVVIKGDGTPGNKGSVLVTGGGDFLGRLTWTTNIHIDVLGDIRITGALVQGKDALFIEDASGMVVRAMGQDNITATGATNLLTAPEKPGDQPGTIPISDFASSDTAIQSVSFAGTQMTKDGTELSITQSNARIALFGTLAIRSTTLPIYLAANGVPTALTSANLRRGAFGSTAIGSTQLPVYWNGSNLVGLTQADLRTGLGLGSAAYETSGSFASLDGNGKLLIAELPDLIMGQMLYAGTVNASRVATLTANAKTKLGLSASTSTITLQNMAGTATSQTGWIANQGNYYIASVPITDTQFGIAFRTGDWLIATDTGWTKIENTDAVTGVKGNSETTYRVGGVNITAVHILGTTAIGSTQLPVYWNGSAFTALTQANLRLGSFGSTAIGTASQPVYWNGSNLVTGDTIPAAANDGTLTVTQNGVSRGTFGANASSDEIIDIPAPLMWEGTRSAYNSISPKDSNTLYCITDPVPDVVFAGYNDATSSAYVLRLRGNVASSFRVYMGVASSIGSALTGSYDSISDTTRYASSSVSPEGYIWIFAAAGTINSSMAASSGGKLGYIAQVNQNYIMIPNFGNIHKGSTRISKIYKGTTEVFNANPEGISAYPVGMIAPILGMADMMPDLAQQQALVELLNPVIDVLIN